MHIFRCVCVIAIGLLLHPIFSNGQIPGLYGTTPIALPAITTSSTSVLIPVVNTYRTSVNRGMTVYYFEYLFWELALDSAFTRRVAWELWKNNAGECLTRRDTLPLRIEGIRPDSKHYFRVQAMNVNPTGVDPRDSLVRRFYFSPFTRPMLIETPVESIPTAPRLLLPTNISHNTMTLNWLPAQGLPTIYEVQISTDSTFQVGTITQTTVNSFLPLNGLMVNTRYFYRIRAGNQRGFSSFSLRGSEQTFQSRYPFTADNITPNVAFQIQGRYNYAYSVSDKINMAQVDSLLAVVANNGISVTSAWFQDATNFNYAANPVISIVPSVLMLAVTKETSLLDSLGFRKRSIYSPEIVAWFCDDPFFRRYDNFVITSVSADIPSSTYNRKNNLYPNPCDTEINLDITLTSASEVQYEIWNVLGHSVHSSSKQFLAQGAGTIPIATDALPNGVYMVRVALRSAFAAPVYLYRQFTVVH